MNLEKFTRFLENEIRTRDSSIAAHQIIKYFAEEIESMLGDASSDIPEIKVVLETRNVLCLI